VTSPKPYDISKRRLLEAYWRVKANRGAAGIDGESLEMFEADLTGNLYKLWNRLSSGSYFPPPVRQVEIPKKNGGVRILGVPTVADRVAQQVAVTRIGGDLFGVFHPDSHGYQLDKSAVNAVANTRKRCWEYDWVVEFDIRRAFDELDWDLLRKAIAKHVKDPWCSLYIERWLTASAVSPDGQPVQRTKGVPQGSVIGPVLMNLFMTYAFDKWMEREHPNNPFSRYADDAVAHCRSEAEAKKLLASIEERLKECKLEMHPEKSGIVYCKDSSRRKDYPKVPTNADAITCEVIATRLRRLLDWPRQVGGNEPCKDEAFFFQVLPLALSELRPAEGRRPRLLEHGANRRELRRGTALRFFTAIGIRPPRIVCSQLVTIERNVELSRSVPQRSRSPLRQL
jgi:RNA-directed DNA polymerase